MAGGGAGLTPDLVLTASASSVTPSTNVTFTASATPAAVHNDWRLFAVQSWEWVPDSGSQAASCGTSKTCNFTPQSSGTMKVTALVNGTVQTEERYVSVLPCLTGDSLLDDARIRRALKEAWEGSNADGPQSGRVERVGGRFPGPPPVDTTFPPLPGASACRGWNPSQWNWNSPGQGGPVVTWHTHPFNHGEQRQSSSVCPERGAVDPTRMFIEPASGTDFSGGGDLPLIIVSPNFVFLYYYDATNTRYGVDNKATPNIAAARSACDAASI